jgi:superfamily I DNA and/or RNA helicase
MGVFLGTTYRMHSAVNQFISQAIYDGKLIAASHNDKQTIDVPEDYKGVLDKEAGIITVPVQHEGNTQASDEEVDVIKVLAKQLIGRLLHDKNGTSRPLAWNDILFVAPYNHQVNKLQEALGHQVKVGSVDKFQGQEAPVIILSMCASDASDSPRGMDFLFDKHRLNVAISRAQSMAVVVYSPAILNTSINSVRQMEQMNVFCKLEQVL